MVTWRAVIIRSQVTTHLLLLNCLKVVAEIIASGSKPARRMGVVTIGLTGLYRLMFLLRRQMFPPLRLQSV